MSQFWLKVKESYIIENFDDLVKYLSSYKVLPNGEIDEDFEETYKYLQKVAHEQCIKAFNSTNLYERYRNEDNLDLIALVHLTLASILTSHNYKHEDDYFLLTHLANIILLNKPDLDAEKCQKLLHFVQMCIERRNIKRFSLNWSHVNSSLDFILVHMLFTEWEAVDNQATESSIYYEQNGTALANSGNVTLAALNLKDYKITKGNSPTIISLQNGFKVKSKTISKLKASSTPIDVIAKTTELLREFSQIKPSYVKDKKEYSEYQIMPVMVLKKSFNNIVVSTIDPAYKEISGNLQVQTFVLAGCALIAREELINEIKVGEVVYAKYHLGSFIIDQEVYYNFYIKDIETYCYSDQEAVRATYLADYSVGTRWLDENGLLVNIYNGNLSDEDYENINFAIDNHYSIYVKYTTIAERSVLNGQFLWCSDDDDEIIDHASFAKKARLQITQDFIGYGWEETRDLPKNAAFVALDSCFSLIVAARALYMLSKVRDTTLDRVKTLATAIILDEICGENAINDKEFMMHEMKFLECGIKFVRGDNPANLSLTHSDNLDGVSRIMLNEKIVKVLSGYQQDDDIDSHQNISAAITTSNTIDIDNISKLVEASNILRGKIQEKSLARIKAEIAAKLELDDEYIPESVDNESTYYGVESDTLEFKSSVVFPPCNRQTGRGTADPDNQRWVIIKTVCGFLNSHSGGDLYIGVRDNGYACGLKDDIDKLYELDKIHNKSMDSFRNYVKIFLDQAFVSYDKKHKGTDITVDNINYFIMTDNAGLDILRIRVEPFNYDAVFISSKNRPDWMAEAYVRTSGATVPITESVKDRIRRKRINSK